MASPVSDLERKLQNATDKSKNSKLKDERASNHDKVVLQSGACVSNRIQQPPSYQRNIRDIEDEFQNYDFNERYTFEDEYRDHIFD